MIRNNETEEKFLKLDNYIREIHGLNDELSPTQKEKEILNFLSS